MLLAIDIGNSNISVGLFGKGRDLKFLASIDTDSRKTADQISIDLMNLFALYGYDIHKVTGAIFSSVVPGINFMMHKALTRLLGKEPMVVGPGIKTGLNIRMEVHNQLGTDLVANAVAAVEKYQAPIIMIEMGTATTISYISRQKTYEGGMMFPGVRLSLDALSEHSALLQNVALQHPTRNLIGKNTEDCMRNGIVYGTAGGRDLVSLRNSIEQLAAVREQLAHFTTGRLGELSQELDPLTDIAARIAKAVEQVQSAFHKQLDALNEFRFINLESEMDVLADMLKSDGLTAEPDAPAAKEAEAPQEDDPFASLFAKGEKK